MLIVKYYLLVSNIVHSTVHISVYSSVQYTNGRQIVGAEPHWKLGTPCDLVPTMGRVGGKTETQDGTRVVVVVRSSSSIVTAGSAVTM